LLYLVLVSIVWGFSFIIIKGALSSLDSNFVSLVRMVLSFFVLMPFTRISGIPFSDKARLMLIGGIQFGLMYVTYVASFQYLPAHVVALLTTTTPLFVAGFNDLLNKEFKKTIVLAAMLAVAGCAVIKLPKQSMSSGLYGIALLQISNAAFAYGQIAYKRLMETRENLQDKKVFGLMYGGAVMVTGIFSLVFTDYPRLSIQPHQWMALGYLGIIASGCCFYLWNLGARKVNAGTLAVMNNLKIPIGVIAGLVILKESTDYLRLLFGCGLFAAALWMTVSRRSEGPQVPGS
jgi:drug/metabolite transporter (DMT)-like permease